MGVGTQIFHFKYEKFILNVKNFQMSLDEGCCQIKHLYKVKYFSRECNHWTICKLIPMCLYIQSFVKKNIP